MTRTTVMAPEVRGSHLYSHRIDLPIPERTHPGELVSLPLADLTPYERNARTHTVEQLESLARSLSEFGFVRPILIDEDKVIIAGHGIHAAALAMGIETGPCVIISGLTDDQKRAYVIADNRLAERSDWDNDLLSLELIDLKELIDLRVLGFDGWEPRELNETFTTQTASTTTCPECGHEW